MIIVRNDISMKKGKKAAQIGHVSLSAYRHMLEKNEIEVALWESVGSYIDIVKGNFADITAARIKAIQHNINANVIHDAGRTQVRNSFTTSSYSLDSGGNTDCMCYWPR